MASGDSPTLISVISNHRSRIGADVLIVLDAEGRPLASSLASLSPRTQSDLKNLIDENSEGQQLRAYRLIDGRPYRWVLSPVLAPNTIGWAAMGFALDDKVAGDLARLLGVEVSFVAGGGQNPLFVASSLETSQRAGLTEVTTRVASIPFSIRVADDEFVPWTNPIRSVNGPLTLVLQRSLGGALRPTWC